MSLVINHNLMALNAARNLDNSYSQLGVSTRRLSSGLRVGTAADDAAGLAIRELMRADIASMNQGMRNANDAVSMIQTADGALSVLDEKLIRMKELATQAATGTYTSDQRLIIDSEYQAMASEITRIAAATDFNGIYLLNGNLSGRHSGGGINPTGALKIHFGTGNSSAEDYYYVSIGNMTAAWLGPGLGMGLTSGVMIDRAVTSYGNAWEELYGESGMKAVVPPAGGRIYDSNISDFRNGLNAFFADAKTKFLTQEYGGDENLWNQQVDVHERGRMTTSWIQAGLSWAKNNGDHPGAPADFGSPPDYINPVPTATAIGPTDPTWGSTAGSATTKQLLSKAYSGAGSFAGNTIYTQSDAQNALDSINKAITQKDQARANIGATQNRLQNTIQNIAIQAENLQAAESRISDVDVSTEMTQFVRQQILTQAAVAMLAQANSLPKMAMQLIGG